MQIDQCREAFEKHVLAPNGFYENGAGWVARNTDGTYRHENIQARWTSWQAAHSAPAAPVELPEPIGVVRVFEPHEGVGKICSEASTDITRLPIGRSLLYTEQQVRELLSEAGTVLPETPESPPKSAETRMDASSDRGGGVLPEPEVDLPRAGQKALDEYLKWCKEHLIVPDVGGAFAYAIRAGAKIAAAPKLPQCEGWLPIESAPKDGSEILLVSRKGRIANGCWMTANGKVGAWIWPYVLQEPVHWAPLPQPPKEQGS